MDIIDEREKRKIKFLKSQTEKSHYLDEFKENVIAALKKDQLIEDEVYYEIFEAMKETDAVLMKMRRDIPIKKLKPYIAEAEKIGLKYQLVDGLTYVGDVALVVVAKEAMENSHEDVLVRDMDQDFIDAGLGEIYSKSRGKKICKDCYRQVEENLPVYKGSFKKINILDRIFGRKCPICKK